MLGKITFGPFVEELEDDEDGDTCVSSSLDSKEERYWSSVKIPLSIEPLILDIITKIFNEKECC